MIQLKTPEQIQKISRAGEIVAQVLESVSSLVEPGVSTAQLDLEAEELVRSHPGAEPAFKGLYGFPATLCTSVNQEVVHGIPSHDRVLKSGDLLSVDVGVKLDGYFADAALTVPVGDVPAETRRLLAVTRQSLADGIAAARVDNRIGDIGVAVQTTVEAAGYSVIRELVGHGVGCEPHEDPQVPNYGRGGAGIRLQEGLVIAIEPMVNIGRRQVRTLRDGWTVVTGDGSLSAHFEHTVAVTAHGPRILTRLPVEVGASMED